VGRAFFVIFICLDRHMSLREHVLMADGFTVIADPSRRQILDLLLAEERDVSELVVELGVAQPNVSKHLRILRDAGLVDARVEGPRRVYRLTNVPLPDVEAWLAPHRERWGRAFDALEQHLDTQEDRS
jgi:DNA-binding transcriptional ArsR family regulator